MKVYVRKGASGFIVVKETVLQSVISDGMSALVLFSAIGINRWFSSIFEVMDSFFINIITAVALIAYCSFSVKKKEYQREYVENTLDQIEDEIIIKGKRRF